jgi:hypothetical protein
VQFFPTLPPIAKDRGTFHDQGFAITVGFDTRDYLELRVPEHRNRFRIGFERGVLPFASDTFDLVIWEELGFEWKWIEQESFETNSRRTIRWAGRVNRVFPLICWISRTFVTRRVLLSEN